MKRHNTKITKILENYNRRSVIRSINENSSELYAMLSSKYCNWISSYGGDVDWERMYMESPETYKAALEDVREYVHKTHGVVVPMHIWQYFMATLDDCVEEVGYDPIDVMDDVLAVEFEY